MTTLLTTAGATWLGQILAGTTPTNSFTGLELGQGNNVPAVADTRANLTSKIGASLVNVSAGYPILGDSDLRNDGRGVSTYTWKWVYPEGSLQILASNAIVTNYAAGAPGASEPVMVSSSTVLTKRVDQELTVFVNVTQAGAASLNAHVVDRTPLPEQVNSWADREALLSGGPGSQQRSGTDVFSSAREGQPVPTMWFLRHTNGAPLVRADVAMVLVRVSVRRGDNRWTFLYETAPDVDAVMFTSEQRNSRLWKAGGGFYGSYTFVPAPNHGSKQTRLEIILTLVGGGTRVVVHEIDYRPVS